MHLRGTGNVLSVKLTWTQGDNNVIVTYERYILLNKVLGSYNTPNLNKIRFNPIVVVVFLKRQSTTGLKTNFVSIFAPNKQYCFLNVHDDT